MLFLLLACEAPPSAASDKVSPSDDPADYSVDTSISYRASFGEIQWVVPSDTLPSALQPMASNNNVELHFFEGKLYFAWRSAPTHFASEETIMWIVSSENDGLSWELEHEIALGSDLREPRFLSLNGELQFSFFEAGTNPAAFEPKQLWRIWKTDAGWSEPEPFGDDKSVLWDLKVRYGTAYMTTYDGAHYGDGDVYVRFWSSEDGRNWELVDGVDHVYAGGVSEVAFEFDAEGNLWAIGRNEDVDITGAGTQICSAPASALADWTCLEESDPNRYDSPELFRHGNELYLLARRDIDGPYGPEGDLIAYSMRPKAFSLYQLDTENMSVLWLQDLPGVGDTAFPSVRRLNEHTFRFANYTSPLDDPEISWFAAQTSPLGSQIYMMDIEFIAE